VVGITGPPGGGKSTLVSALIKALRAQGRTVAVVAVDPSSPFTGGAVLGDRIRMGEHQADEGVFIRSLASRGHLGGLSRAAADAIDVFDAAGYDTIITETVGAGQSEVEITRVADTRLVVCPPGLGDDVQAIKAGVLEIADAFVVSKADLPDAHRTERDLQAMLALRRQRDVMPPIFRTQATAGEGIGAVADWLAQRTERGTRLGSAADRKARSIVRRAIAADAYARHLGLELVEAGHDHATVQMTVGPQHINFNGDRPFAVVCGRLAFVCRGSKAGRGKARSAYLRRSCLRPDCAAVRGLAAPGVQFTSFAALTAFRARRVRGRGARCARAGLKTCAPRRLTCALRAFPRPTLQALVLALTRLTAGGSSQSS
jgi:LAO/AO transport system ATPase